MTATNPALRARALGLPITLLVLGVLVALLASCSDPASDDGAARDAADRYLTMLSDPDADPAELATLVATGEAAALDRAADLLSRATERISDVSIGDAHSASTATTTSDIIFDRFEEFDVDYELAGEQHEATIALGLPRDGDGWLVVTPLAGSVDWSAAAWGTTLLDVVVDDVEVTEPGRTTRDPEVTFLHPAVYPVSAHVGSYFDSAGVDLAVTADGSTTALPAFTMTPTVEGTSAVTRAALTAFDPCRSGTASCPALQVMPGTADLPTGWWGGLVTEPTVTIEGTRVLLDDGSFRVTTADGVQRSVGFTGSTSLTIDPTTRVPGVALPLDLERAPAP